MPPPKKQRLSASNPGASSQPPKPTSGVKLLSTAPEGSGATASIYVSHKMDIFISYKK